MITPIKGKKHVIIKRDGREEQYNPAKLKKALNWCADNHSAMTNQLTEALNIKLYNKIKIEKLWDEVIATSANLISDMYPTWDNVAKRAYLMKLYKETYNTRTIENSNYPNYLNVVKKGVSLGVYTKDIFSNLTNDEIVELGNYIKIERDLDFSFIGLVSIIDKYSMNQSLTKKLELPQHIYMRLAIAGFLYDTSSNKLDKIKKRYDDLSQFMYTEATPKMVSSLSPKPQLASCILQEVNDNIESINYVDSSLALFSKHGGGLAVDISKIRCSTSTIGNNGGRSDGPIPFIKKFEATVNSFNQNGKRKGACVITFPFWHYDAADLIMLKDAGGSEDKRARGLQYTLKWYQIFTNRIKANEHITLFDPKETPELNTTWGDDFTKWYLYYEAKAGIRKKRILARDLAFLVTKVRSETGNLYIVFPDNINSQRMNELPVFASNLCTEIMEPVKASHNFNHTTNTSLTTGNTTTSSTCDTGEIALCNLTSINLLKWYYLTPSEKSKLIDNLLEASDNLINYQFYPVADGEYSNRNRRPIGIGQSNYAGLLADNQILFTETKAEQFTHDVFEDLAYHIYKGSNELAQERGAYNHFKESEWAKGKLPMDKTVQKSTFKLNHPWSELSADIVRYGLRFSLHMATAPTQTSGQIIQATEGIEPIKRLVQMKEGTYTLPVLAPNLRKNRQYYQSAFDIPNKTLNKLNSIRQAFIDQSQSFSHYYRETDSAYEILTDIIDAEQLGLKSLYYLQPMKSDDIEGCESCSS